ncbi:hypothetical protein GE253_09420 [Niveispirillum sp. SYP-B3756]|uniref:hypothetical protein n=1 Tax=Niveispirillum sp. SYP-B3756 TaxID=2662178 RepID=UPI0012921234|nr:hypothetical protein [Niveispirillum sp. SYP-B3756]MQP65564.1 hypothetical protein [Niveispirillum sp. SYP-B3756]
MQRKSLFLSLAFFVALSNSAAAGPFGQDASQQRNQLNIIKELSPFKYEIKPNKTHPAFESYIANIHPDTGMCMIRGVGITKRNDKYGIEVRRVFEDLREQLSRVYGSSDLFNHIKTDGIWKDDDEWMMAIYKKERSYQASWDNESHAQLKDGIIEILLSVSALSDSSGYVTVQYRFSNWDKCKAAMQNSQAGAL